MYIFVFKLWTNYTAVRCTPTISYIGVHPARCAQRARRWRTGRRACAARDDERPKSIAPIGEALLFGQKIIVHCSVVDGEGRVGRMPAYKRHVLRYNGGTSTFYLQRFPNDGAP